MKRSRTLTLQVLSGLFLLAISIQVARLAAEGDPLEETEAVFRDPPAAPSAAASAAPAPASFPESYKAIDTSGIFGSAPKNPWTPTLLGIAGKHAFLLAADGRSDPVPEGGELGGMKVIRIGTNRVLIEYEGKQMELTLFSGLGSSSLLPAGKEKSP